jgi:hypothetical protein
MSLHEFAIYFTLFLGILCAVTGKRYAACILGSLAFSMVGMWQLTEGRLMAGLAALALVGFFMYYFFYLRRLRRKK